MSGIITTSVNISPRCNNFIPEKVVHKRRFTTDTKWLLLGSPNIANWSRSYERSASWIPRKEISMCFVHTGCVLLVSLVSSTDFKACCKGCDQIEENLRRTRNPREPTEWQRKITLWGSENILQKKRIKMSQSQGKVQRSHRTLRRKINYNLVKQG